MQSTQLINILRQRTEDVDVKQYFIQYLEKARSFEYTRKVLFALEEQALEEISKLGGNPVLSAVYERLRAVYVRPPIDCRDNMLSKRNYFDVMI
ncbi:geranylgeranyl pyrophosphate synthase-like [Corticium candelabrum]|uniref:geranylgeranyl pyrophosphate synthase-like n=1 Tax=Corticium candelabrum TaxID=121492 RepID=UPI002E263DC9|nr:geranylgeranyl pyrophosphate synthase-like [Corticium candelabrum]